MGRAGKHGPKLCFCAKDVNVLACQADRRHLQATADKSCVSTLDGVEA